MTRPPVRRRSELEIRWRQFRNPPRPILRAVLSSLIVATILGLVYLAYDLAISRGASLPGGDLRTLAVTLFVVIVLGSGSRDHLPRRAPAERLGRDPPAEPLERGPGPLRGLADRLPGAGRRGPDPAPPADLTKAPMVRRRTSTGPLTHDGGSPFVLFRATLPWSIIRCGRPCRRPIKRSSVSDEQHLALPQLFGAPAYSRPPRPVAGARPTVRPRRAAPRGRTDRRGSGLHQRAQRDDLGPAQPARGEAQGHPPEQGQQAGQGWPGAGTARLPRARATRASGSRAARSACATWAGSSAATSK